MAKPKVSECSNFFFFNVLHEVSVKKKKIKKNFFGQVEKCTPFSFRNYPASAAECLIPFCIVTP